MYVAANVNQNCSKTVPLESKHFLHTDKKKFDILHIKTCVIVLFRLHGSIWVGNVKQLKQIK